MSARTEDDTGAARADERAAPPRLSVVICTKDRHVELAACLESLARQTRLPTEVVVVDASDVAPDRVVDAFRRRVAPACDVTLVRAQPGLTRQRNIGLDAATGAVVLFLDDDVVLEPDYLAELVAVYERDREGRIGGVGGAIVPDPTLRESRVQRALQRLFLLPAYGRGRVKRSGYPEYLLSPRVETAVDFLSGCNMSFRREALAGLRFDERLDGYSHGEDLHFSYQVSRRWRLVLTPRARLDHRETGGGRPTKSGREEMAVFNHYLFFRGQIARRPLDWLVYLWAALGRVFWTVWHPGAGRLRGVLSGYTRVARDLSRRPAAPAVELPLERMPEAICWQPLVSVVVPVRNEEGFLGRCLDSILAQGYPPDRIEVIVVENHSTDRTHEVAAARAAMCDRIHVLTSDAVNQAAAMNEGIQAARGDVIARVDAHSYVDPDYVQGCVAALARNPRAAGVGGPFLAAGEGLVERVTGLARSSRIGVGGGYGPDREARDHLVRSVQCGAYRRGALRSAGGFDVAMAYGEDEDLNWRLTRRGWQIVLCPALRQRYRPRGSFQALACQYWNYGQGRLRVLRKHPDFLQARHLVPSLFIALVAVLGGAAPLSPLARRGLAGLAGAYALALAAAGIGARAAGWREALLVPPAVAVIHLAYGAGMLWGAVRRLVGGPQVATRSEEVTRWQGAIRQWRSR